MVEITVADEGSGFDPEIQTGRGYGLFSIRERLQHLGGVMRIRSAPGQGTTVTLAVPAGEGSGPAGGLHR
jgi:signal transduction histidine kinase